MLPEIFKSRAGKATFYVFLTIFYFVTLNDFRARFNKAENEEFNSFIVFYVQMPLINFANLFLTALEINVRFEIQHSMFFKF